MTWLTLILLIQSSQHYLSQDKILRFKKCYVIYTFTSFFFFYTELLIGVDFYLKEKKPEVKVVLADTQVILKMYCLIVYLFCYILYCIVKCIYLAVKYVQSDIIRPDFIPTYHQILKFTKTKHLP